MNARWRRELRSPRMLAELAKHGLSPREIPTYDGPPTTKKRQKSVKPWRKYGLTAEQFQALYEQQQGLCAICRQPPGARELAIDHCHDTGVVRGLLCTRCNLMIGYAKDRIETLRAAIHYLLFAP